MNDEHERTGEIDPLDFLRRALKISPDDAASVREDAARAMKADEGPEPSDAPTGDPTRPSNPA